METVSAMGNKALLVDSTQWGRYLYLYSKKNNFKNFKNFSAWEGTLPLLVKVF